MGQMMELDVLLGVLQDQQLATLVPEEVMLQQQLVMQFALMATSEKQRYVMIIPEIDVRQTVVQLKLDILAMVPNLRCVLQHVGILKL